MNWNRSLGEHRAVEQGSICVLTGPTGGGKSALAIALARALGAEIINADSVQLYEGFVIGAGSPTVQQRMEVPHHLYNVFSPASRSDVYHYCQTAIDCIREVQSRGKLPLIVGGTGLYIRALLHGLVSIPTIDEALLQEVETELEDIRQSAADAAQMRDAISRYLSEADEQLVGQLHPSDTQRIVRAVAVKRQTGRSLIEMQAQHSLGAPRFRALVLYLEPERERLYERINLRVLQMWDEGIVEEVRELIARYSTQCHPLAAIGYSHVCEYLAGHWNREQAIALMQRDTRRFAKRQMTWWRNQPDKLGWERQERAPELNAICDIVSYSTGLVGVWARSSRRTIAFQTIPSLE